jgi:4-aminobutyrate aminotransferase-like enzyme
VIQQEHLLENADKVGDVMLNGLRDMAERHDSIREVRGLALMIGVEFPDHDFAAEIEHRAFAKGLLVLTCGDDAVRMAPPLVFREDQARTALELFEETVADIENAGS